MRNKTKIWVATQYKPFPNVPFEINKGYMLQAVFPLLNINFDTYERK